MMMRRFAWCDTNRSMSDAVRLLRASSRAQTSPVLVTANLKTVCALLLDVVQALVHGLVRRRLPAAAGRHAQRRPAAAVHLVLEVEDAEPVLRRRADDHGAGAVAEEHAGRAIGVVDDARHHVGADHQRMCAPRPPLTICAPTVSE